MKIVVSGATGFIGRRLVTNLVNAGDRVVALSRDPARAEVVLPARCQVAPWSAEQGVAATLLTGSEAVVHLAGEGVADRRWSEARKREIYDSRVLGTRALVEALRAVPVEQRPKSLITASAIGYYGDRGQETVDESSPHGKGFLAEVCGAWEREAFAAEQLGMRVVAVRIGIVLGRGGGALRQLLPLFQLGAGGRVGSGSQWMSWIHLEDLVRIFELALTRDEIRGPINAVAPHPVTNADFTRALAAAVHRPALVPAPAIALRLAMGEMSTIVLASQRVAPTALSRHGFEFGFETLAPALDDICSDDEEILEREQWLPYPPEEVFPFFSDARNLEKITPDSLSFQVVSMEPPTLAEGTLINYRLRLHGLPVGWQSRIEDWDPPRKFVDVQTKGPYALWHHTHEFAGYRGGTVVRDRVRYRLPLGALGTLAGSGFVSRDLERIFAYRREQLKQIFPKRPQEDS